MDCRTKWEETYKSLRAPTKCCNKSSYNSWSIFSY